MFREARQPVNDLSTFPLFGISHHTRCNEYWKDIHNLFRLGKTSSESEPCGAILTIVGRLSFALETELFCRIGFSPKNTHSREKMDGEKKNE